MITRRAVTQVMELYRITLRRCITWFRSRFRLTARRANAVMLENVNDCCCAWN
jgi:hypothetical protein